MKHIREWQKEDAALLAKALSNKKVTDNLRDGLPYPYTEKDAAEFIEFIHHSDKNDVFIYAVTVDGKAVGNVGVERQNNVHRLTAELGYYLDEDYWGRGIMTEAVRELCDHVFKNSDIIRIFADVYADNIASCRVLEKAGFRLEGIMQKAAIKNGVMKDMKIYALLKNEK